MRNPSTSAPLPWPWGGESAENQHILIVNYIFHLPPLPLDLETVRLGLLVLLVPHRIEQVWESHSPGSGGNQNEVIIPEPREWSRRRHQQPREAPALASAQLTEYPCVSGRASRGLHASPRPRAGPLGRAVEGTRNGTSHPS